MDHTSSAADEEEEIVVVNEVVASSSADELEQRGGGGGGGGGGGRGKRRRRHHQRTEEAKKKGKWEGGGGEQVPAAGPHMEPPEFCARYFSIDSNVTKQPPFDEGLPCNEKQLLRECFTFVSPTQLDALEDQWRDYSKKECELTFKKTELYPKYWALLGRSQEAYHYHQQQEEEKELLAVTNKKRSQLAAAKKKREFGSRFPLVNAGFVDLMALPVANDIRREYLITVAQQQLRELEAELLSYYDAVLCLYKLRLQLIGIQTHLLHVGTKAYRKYYKSFTKAAK